MSMVDPYGAMQIMKNEGAYRLGKEVIGAGNWLRLETIRYRDREGKERSWEAAERSADRQAVMVVARLMPSEKYLLVEQYRPPVDATVLEFPAGLIDDGESPGEAALRELREETGYAGRIVHTGPPCVNTPGMTSEAAYVVFVEIDENTPANHDAQPDQDDGEEIDVHCIGRDEVSRFLENRADSGVRIDNKVYCFFTEAW